MFILYYYSFQEEDREKLFEAKLQQIEVICFYTSLHMHVSALYLVRGTLGCLPYLSFDMYLIILVLFLFLPSKYTITKLYL